MRAVTMRSDPKQERDCDTLCTRQQNSAMHTRRAKTRAFLSDPMSGGTAGALPAAGCGRVRAQGCAPQAGRG